MPAAATHGGALILAEGGRGLFSGRRAVCDSVTPSRQTLFNASRTDSRPELAFVGGACVS